MSLQEQLDAQKAQSVNKIPAEQLAIMGAATNALRESGILDQVVKPGMAFPEFELLNTRKATVSSRDLVSRGTLVATFYRGVW